MYLISVAIPQIPTYFVAVPFLRMALELYPHLRSIASGRSVQYRTYHLDETVKKIRAGQNLEGAVKLSNVRYKIDGDSLLDTLIFRGKNLSPSPTFQKILAAGPAKGTILSPERVRLAYDNDTQHLTIEMDTYGHCKFWLSRRAANISALFDVMMFLHSNGLILESASFPFMKALTAEVTEGDKE